MCYGANLMKPIRSSDIGSYLYCARAWWYRQQGVESSNQAELTAGTELHRQHGRRVLAAGVMRTLALVLLLAALALLAAFCTARLV
jgi:CRISPR/Cas system-associated exonuclease Cas4 (RecB family)